MENKTALNKAYIVTGPTSGIGYATALELAKHGTVILVARNREKLEQVQKTIKGNGHNAVSVVCDVSDIKSVQRAAQQIIDLKLNIAGLLNNAGVMPTKPVKSVQGWDSTFATNHLGTFALTEALVPHLPDGANVVFIASAIEDAERKPAKVMGMKGGRYISAEASAKGEWKQPGSKLGGIDAYATSKQCIMASAMFFAKENPRLHFNLVEPGITPGTNLGGNNANAFMSFLFGQIISKLPPFSQYRSTPEKSAKVIAKVLIDESGKTGVYYDEKGVPMHGSALVHDAKFQTLVVNETRAFLAKNK